jgi:succinate dehydrogenase/fumarate reductase cytochrome b subunit
VSEEFADELTDEPRSKADVADGADSADGAGAFSGRWHKIAGYAVLLWVLWYLAQLVALRLDPLWFADMHEWSGALGARLAACAVLGALLYHGLNGLRIVVLESVREPSGRLMSATDLGVLFLGLAVWIPAATVVLWPAVEGRF